MSLFGSINTAVSGLTAQSTSFGNISEDVANSQTVGFKRIDTSFADYLTTSTPTQNEPGAVIATPDYVNTVQGTITQTDNPLGMAISGQGFFAVSRPTSAANNQTTFSPQQYYSRTGDFTMNAQGYLVNSAGDYLNGWAVNPATNVVTQNALGPIQVSQATLAPLATSSMTLAANLPATPTSGTATATSPLSSQITVYDSNGTGHTVELNWSQVTNAGAVVPNQWNVQIQVPDAASTLGDGSTPNYTDAGSATVTFGSTTSTVPPSGTIASITPVAASSTPPGGALAGGGSYAATPGQAATLGFTTNFGSGNQTISLDLGTYGGTTGMTQFAGTVFNLNGSTQNGYAPGSFTGVTTQAGGEVVVNYDNGQSRTIAQIPLVTFAAPDALQRQNGQAFTATTASGTPLAQTAGKNGAGSIVTGSVEGSNVDIATEFSHLIVAQQAYSSNAKVVTTANQMLQATLTMVA